MSSKNREIINP